jgi:magnesium chelatase subunit D
VQDDATGASSAKNRGDGTSAGSREGGTDRELSRGGGQVEVPLPSDGSYGNRERSGVGFPFSALVGQEELKLALLAAVVEPKVGGVLVVGQRGTAKSTAVRGLARILPRIEVVADCPFSCEPGSGENCPGGPHPPDAKRIERSIRVVELPVGCSLDRLVGELDLGAVLSSGTVKFRPGLLALAHRGILYADEVNLLPDHIVDALLDAAAMGYNYVEREGLSLGHPAEFVLVGTMNPDEGDLRPQLLDRFGLCVAVRAPEDPQGRAAIVQARLAFDADPEAFAEAWQEEESRLAGRIEAAKAVVRSVEVDRSMVVAAASVCSSVGVEGMRADIGLLHCARALAALDGRTKVEVRDLVRAARMVLPHRMGGTLSLEKLRQHEEIVDKTLEELLGDPELPDPDGQPPGDGKGDTQAFEGDSFRHNPTQEVGGIEENSAGADPADGSAKATYGGPYRHRPTEAEPGSGGESDVLLGEPLDAALSRQRILLRLALAGKGAGPSGRRSTGRLSSDAKLDLLPWDRASGFPLDLLGTLKRVSSKTNGRSRLPESASDLRARLTYGKEQNLFVFVLDTSGSMAAKKRLELTSRLLASLLEDAYRKRDSVAVATFSGESARVVVPPTTSIRVALEALRGESVGGRSPFGAGLHCGAALAERERRKNYKLRVLGIVVSDGRANHPWPTAFDAARQGSEAFCRACDAVIFLDTEAAFPPLGVNRRLAEWTGAVWLPAWRLDDSVTSVLLQCASAFRRRVA